MEFFTSCIQIIIITSKKHLLVLLFFLFLFAIYILFVRSILFPNNKLHQGLLQKRKIDPIELYAWLLSNRLFQYKIQRALLIFQFLTDCSNIRWFSGWKKKCPSLQYMYVSHSHRFILCQKSEMKLNSILLIVICLLCTQGYFYIFWGRKVVGWFLNQQYFFCIFSSHTLVVWFLKFFWWASYKLLVI